MSASTSPPISWVDWVQTLTNEGCSSAAIFDRSSGLLWGKHKRADLPDAEDDLKNLPDYEVVNLACMMNEPDLALEEIDEVKMEINKQRFQMIQVHLIPVLANIVAQYAKDTSFRTLGQRGIVFGNKGFIFIRGESGEYVLGKRGPEALVMYLTKRAILIARLDGNRVLLPAINTTMHNLCQRLIAAGF